MRKAESLNYQEKHFYLSQTLEVRRKKKGSRKEYIVEEVSIPKEEIKETKLKINFK